jgi:hypothetical protein
MRFNIKRLGEFPLNLGDTVSKTTSTPVLPVLSGQVAGWSIHENYHENLFQDNAKTTLAANDGDVIGGVTPLTGAVDASQTTTAAKPLLKTSDNGINGHWAAQFDGSDDFWAVTGISSPIAGPVTAYFVIEPDSATGTFEFLFDSQAGRLIFTHLASTNGQVGFFDSVWKNVGAATNVIQILSFVHGSGTGTVYRNGSFLGSDTYTSKAIGGICAIGNDGASPSEAYTGLIGEVHIYDAEHSTSERQQMEAYLSSLWGISLA